MMKWERHPGFYSFRKIGGIYGEYRSFQYWFNDNQIQRKHRVKTNVPLTASIEICVQVACIFSFIVDRVQGKPVLWCSLVSIWKMGKAGTSQK